MVQLGRYVDGPPGAVGVWTALTNETEMDRLPWYKSAKDFWDGAKGRRIFWGWVASAKALPRSVTYHPQLKSLVWSPIEEMAQLHTGQPLADVAGAFLRSGRPYPLFPGPAADVGESAGAGGIAGAAAVAGTVADINVSFALPASAGTLEIEVLGGTLVIFIEYVPPATSSDGSGAYSVRVGVGPRSQVPFPPAPAPNTTANVTRMMPNTDMGGADYSITHHTANWTAADCQALCDGQARCAAWVWAVRGHPAGSGACCLKDAVPCPVRRPPLPSETVTSGEKTAALNRQKRSHAQLT
jgi:hypothetical protein